MRVRRRTFTITNLMQTVETSFAHNRNTFTVTEEKLRIQIGGFHVSLREVDVKDFIIFINSNLVRDYKLIQQLTEGINGKHLH